MKVKSDVTAPRTPSESSVIKVYKSKARIETAFYFEKIGADRSENILWRSYKLVDTEEVDGGVDSMTLKKAAVKLVRDHNAVRVFDEDDNLLASVSSFFGDRDA
jgi:hypothetical protein